MDRYAPLPEDSCVLDVAERSPMTLEQIAELVGVTRERIRQIEAFALRKMKRAEHDQR